MTETFAFDGGRDVTAYVPADPPEMIVYCGDGQLVPHWGADLGVLNLPPALIVGAHGHADETRRLQEYSPGFAPSVFAAHETFLMEEVTAWVETRFGTGLPAERTVAFGVSAGEELALALGARHPGRFGAVFCASPGAGYRPDGRGAGPMPPVYLVAGTQEPFFLENALRWAEALEGDGIDIHMAERDFGHDDAMWRAEFPEMVAWFWRRQP